MRQYQDLFLLINGVSRKAKNFFSQGSDYLAEAMKLSQENPEIQKLKFLYDLRKKSLSELQKELEKRLEKEKIYVGLCLGSTSPIVTAFLTTRAVTFS